MDLLGWVQSTHKGYKAGWAHHRICAKLEEFSAAVVRKESPRLIITMPPRAGKTVIVSQRWPVWHMANNPGHEIIMASCTQDLANESSRKARDEVARAEFAGAVFGTALGPKNVKMPLSPGVPLADGIKKWTIHNGASYQSVGVKGTINGSGAHILIVDDYLRDRRAAESQAERDLIYDWYISTALQRVAPGGGVIIMATRWHTHDLIGQLLKDAETGGETFEVFHLPALATDDEPIAPEDSELAEHYQRQVDIQVERIEEAAAGWRAKGQDRAASYLDDKALKKRCEGLKEDEAGLPCWRLAGEALHPPRYDKAALLARKGAITRRHGLRDWAAQYQGEPIVRTGNRIQRTWFRERYGCTPQEIADQADEVWGTTDPAKKAGKKNDYHSLQIWSRRGKKRHLLARVCGRMEYPEFRSRMDGLIGMWQPWLILGGNGFLVEDTANGTTYLQEREGSHLGVDLIKFHPQKDTPGTDKSKGARFTYLEGPAEAGAIILPDSSNEPWAEEWLDCVCAYPNGVHDDEGDAASQLHMRWTLQEHEDDGGHWDMWT